MTDRCDRDRPAAWTEEVVATAVEQANIPTLLMVVVQMTGDMRWLREPFRPTRNRGLGDNDSGGLDIEVQRVIRDAATEAICDWLSGAPLAIPRPSPELLVEMLSVAMGEPVPADYGEMLAHELGFAQTAGRSEATPTRYEALRRLDALIIGAGASGLCAAVRFQEAGIPFTIVERNAEVGGVWHENRYPGASVDTASHLYSFTFAKHNWTKYFAGRDELCAYFNEIADSFGLREHIRFHTEVVSARYDEAAQQWETTLRRRDGHVETIRSRILVSAVGAFNKPKYPNIPGLKEFDGPVVHTARWDEDLDLRGKRVAVVGNGASGMQLVPAIAGMVQSVVVYQRSPQWAAPFEKFQKPVSDGVSWLFEHVPLYDGWYRQRLAWTFNDRNHESLQKDPSWPHPDRAINAVNDGHRAFFTRHIVTELGDRQDLLSKCLPTYPPFGKRMLLDNGWFKTMTRSNVELRTAGITRVGQRSIVDEEGEEREVDVIALATGFDVVRLLAPMEVVGRDGEVLDEFWNHDDARAYLGLTVPKFPNFFCLYGPNLQFGHGGSVLFMLELQVRYLVSLLEQAADNDLAVVECRRDVFDTYNKEVDAAHEQMVWTHPGMDTYYRNARGRVVLINPFKIVDFYSRVQTADLNDYLTEPFLMP